MKSSDLIGPRSCSIYNRRKDADVNNRRKDAGENGFREIKWAEHRWNTRIGIFFNRVHSLVKILCCHDHGIQNAVKTPDPSLKVEHNGGLSTFPKTEILEEVS